MNANLKKFLLLATIVLMVGMSTPPALAAQSTDGANPCENPKTVGQKLDCLGWKLDRLLEALSKLLTDTAPANEMPPAASGDVLVAPTATEPSTEMDGDLTTLDMKQVLASVATLDVGSALRYMDSVADGTAFQLGWRIRTDEGEFPRQVTLDSDDVALLWGTDGNFICDNVLNNDVKHGEGWKAKLCGPGEIKIVGPHSGFKVSGVDPATLSKVPTTDGDPEVVATTTVTAADVIGTINAHKNKSTFYPELMKFATRGSGTQVEGKWVHTLVILNGGELTGKFILLDQTGNQSLYLATEDTVGETQSDEWYIIEVGDPGIDPAQDFPWWGS